MQASPPPVLRGKAAEAILEDLKRPPTDEQMDVVWLALKELKSAGKGGSSSLGRHAR